MNTNHDFPGVKNTPTGIESTWIFHGVACSEKTATAWRESVRRNKCPWCGATVVKSYNNVNRHLRACPRKPG
jgi:hypothetical protein